MACKLRSPGCEGGSTSQSDRDQLHSPLGSDHVRGVLLQQPGLFQELGLGGCSIAGGEQRGVRVPGWHGDRCVAVCAASADTPSQVGLVVCTALLLSLVYRYSCKSRVYAFAATPLVWLGIIPSLYSVGAMHPHLRFPLNSSPGFFRLSPCRGPSARWRC